MASTNFRNGDIPRAVHPYYEINHTLVGDADAYVQGGGRTLREAASWTWDRGAIRGARPAPGALHREPQPPRLGQVVGCLVAHPEVGVAPAFAFERQLHVGRHGGTRHLGDATARTGSSRTASVTVRRAAWMHEKRIVSPGLGDGSWRSSRSSSWLSDASTSTAAAMSNTETRCASWRSRACFGGRPDCRAAGASGTPGDRPWQAARRTRGRRGYGGCAARDSSGPRRTFPGEICRKLINT